MKRIVAAFDFDGTLTYSDTLLPFLFFAFGRVKTLWKMIPLLPQLSLFFVGFCSRQEAKELILTQFLKGLPSADIHQLGKGFVNGPLMKKFRKEAVDRLKWHKENGHICVLVSANLSFYLSFLPDFDYIIASKAAVDKHDQLTGRLEENNCYGKEKVKGLQAVLGDRSSYILYAYGDSQGDKELLEFADYPFFQKFS